MKKPRRDREWLWRWLITSLFAFLSLIWFTVSFYELILGNYSTLSERLTIFAFGSLIGVVYLLAALLWFYVIYPGLTWLSSRLSSRLEKLIERSPNYSWKERVLMVFGSLILFGLSLILVTNNIMALRGNGLIFDYSDSLLLIMLIVLAFFGGYVSLTLIYAGLTPKEDSPQKS